MEHSINVRIPAALWAQIRKMAINERRSATSQLAVVIERGIAATAPQRAVVSIPAAPSAPGKRQRKQEVVDADSAPLSESAQRYIARQEHYNRTGEYLRDDGDE